jgi:hypothetical protein
MGSILPPTSADRLRHAVRSRRNARQCRIRAQLIDDWLELPPAARTTERDIALFLWRTSRLRPELDQLRSPVWQTTLHAWLRPHLSRHLT